MALVGSLVAQTGMVLSARTVDQSPSGTGALLARIGSALVAGRPEHVLSMGTLKPDVPEVHAFLAKWFVRGTTAAELRERDRLPIQSGPGIALVVEALVEAGAQGRLATWRIDLAPGSTG